MISDAVASPPSARGRLRCWLLWSLLLLLLPGCEGCRPGPGVDDVEKRREEAEKKKRELEAQKPPVEQKAVTVLPGSIPAGIENEGRKSIRGSASNRAIGRTFSSRSRRTKQTIRAIWSLRAWLAGTTRRR